MNEREEQIERMAAVLARFTTPGTVVKPAEAAAALYASGVRVIGLHEAVVPRADIRLLEMVREAAARWEEMKAEARVASVRSDESERTDDVKEQALLTTFRRAQKPISRSKAITRASGRPSGGRSWREWCTAFRHLEEKQLIERDPKGPQVRCWWRIRAGDTQ